MKNRFYCIKRSKKPKYLLAVDQLLIQHFPIAFTGILAPVIRTANDAARPVADSSDFQHVESSKRRLALIFCLYCYGGDKTIRLDRQNGTVDLSEDVFRGAADKKPW